MKLNRIGNTSATEVTLGDWTVLFSYETPVAARLSSSDCREEKEQPHYRTDKFWSITTSKHINQWLEGRICQERSQGFFDDLVT